MFVNVEDFDWIDAAENYVQVHTGPSIHMLHVPMNTMESSLDPENFLRIHRSTIVNVKPIKQLWPLTHGQFVVELSCGTRLQTGRTDHERVKAATANPY